MFIGDHMTRTNRFLRKQMLHLFKLHTEIDSARVDVDVYDGVATLTGKVDGPVARSTLEGLALTVDGISEIINNLDIDSENITGVQGIHIS
jgi:hypothetical protein